MNLITGATGLVGAHLALNLLQQQKPVVAIKRAGSDIQKTKHLFSYYTANYNDLFNQIKWIDADICDVYSLIEAFENIETVYHCAGFVSFTGQDTAQLQKINAKGTANVVTACLDRNISHLVHVSSIATLQNPDIKTNINESVYWKSSPKAGDYAISKYNAEREVWRGMEEGLNITIVNPGFVIGPGFWKQGSGKLFQQLYKGMPFYTKGSTAYIDARDVASIMVKLSAQKIYNKRFILTEGNYSFKDIFSMILKAFGKNEPGMQASATLLNIGKYADSLKSLFTGSERIVTTETINASTEINTYDNSLIKQTLQYTFIPTKESIAFCCNSFLKDKARG